MKWATSLNFGPGKTLFTGRNLTKPYLAILDSDSGTFTIDEAIGILS